MVRPRFSFKIIYIILFCRTRLYKAYKVCLFSSQLEFVPWIQRVDYFILFGRRYTLRDGRESSPFFNQNLFMILYFLGIFHIIGLFYVFFQLLSFPTTKPLPKRNLVRICLDVLFVTFFKLF